MVTSPSLSEPVFGKVVKIGKTVGRQSVMASDPAENADARVIIVTIALDPASSARVRFYTNLEVTGRIKVISP